MISDLDIWRSANVLIKQHGDQPEAEAQKRVDAMRDNTAGRRVWLDILAKVKELRRVEPGERELMH